MSKNIGNAIVEQAAKDIIGLTEEKAEKLLIKLGIKYRYTRRDNEKYFLTCDYIPDRLNLASVDGIIDTVRFG